MNDACKITVAFASDDVTSMPMATAIASLLRTRGEATFLDIHVLSCGISEKSKSMTNEVISRLARGGATLHWHDITGENAKLLTRLYVKSDRPYPPANYARLLIGQILPVDREKVIYMDIDTIALADLRPLWSLPFDGATALVIRDLPHDSGQLKRLLMTVSAEDRENYGLKPEAHYFQAGVMVLDLAPFRSGLVDEIIEILERYPELTFPDQDALNIALARRNKFIDPRWNQMSAVYWYAPGSELPYEAELWEKLKKGPYIVHYSGRPKPWEKGCDHALAQHWQAAFMETPFAESRHTTLTKMIDRLPRVRRVLMKKLNRAFRR